MNEIEREAVLTERFEKRKALLERKEARRRAKREEGKGGKKKDSSRTSPAAPVVLSLLSCSVFFGGFDSLFSPVWYRYLHCHARSLTSSIRSREVEGQHQWDEGPEGHCARCVQEGEERCVEG